MENLLIHLIKSSAILILFLACYHFFLKQETFYSKNRGFLIIGLLSAILLPFFPFINTIIVETTPAIDYSYLITTNLAETTSVSKPFDWLKLLLWCYLLGVVIFTFKLFFKLNAIKKLIKESELLKNEGFKHIVTPKKISPFSFFKYIFYNPYIFKNEELNTIIEHEKVHAQEYHTIDILLSEIILILQWYNPAIWVYKNAIKQNLEFQADARTYSKSGDKKFYQYLLLKEAVGVKNSSITNTFYNSLIKKRIVMLNQKQSKNISLLKLLAVLPLLGVFLVSFNTKEVIQHVTTEDNSTLVQTNNDEGQNESNSDIAILDNTNSTSETDKKITPNTIQSQEAEKNITLIITKNTTNEGLEKIKKNLAEKDIDFSYTVVHNDKGEISSISIHLSGERNGEKFNSNYNTDSDDSIKTIKIAIDEDNNVSIGNADVEFNGDFNFSIHEDHDIDSDVDVDHDVIIKKSKSKGGNKMVWVEKHEDSNGTRVRSRNDGNKMVWIESDHDHENVMIENINGKEVITVNGKKLSKKEAKKFKKNMSLKNVLIETKTTDDSNKNVFIIRTDDDTKKHVIKKEFIVEEDSNNPLQKTFRIRNSDDTLHVIDGEKVTKEEFEKLNKNDILTISILKDIHAKNKYGDEGKNGVVEIITKETKSSLLEFDDDKAPLFVIDGKEVTKKEFEKLDKDHIATIDVSKGEGAIAKYGEKGKNGVIEIITKKNGKEPLNMLKVISDENGKEPLHILNGKEVSKKEVENINKDNIETMHVLKDEQAKEKYGEKGKNGVIEITTKK